MKSEYVLVFALAACIATTAGRSQASVISARDAARTFARADALCEADAGRLWGVSLCVPVMLVDPDTRRAFTNRALPGARRDGTMFRLTLGPDALISTAPTEYEGVRWAQLAWPMYGSAATRAVTLMHESFHIIQPKLGFQGNADNGSISGDPYLDTQTGRVWLRGELAALGAALRASGEARRRAFHDALAMRLYRHSLFAGTAELERRQDLLEGLAEGTGIDAALPASRRIAYALFDMAFVEAQPSYTRAFPYATGPAYSELLDAAQPHWRRAVTPSSDVAQMAMHAYDLSVTAPTASQAQTTIARYDGAVIQNQEAARAARKAALNATYTRELVRGPTITLPMTHFKITFNPRDIESLAPYGSVYHTLTVTAPWGTITVWGGDAMISKDFRVLDVAAPADVAGKAVRGRGWTLDLAAGCAIVPAAHRTGSYILSVRR